MVQQNEPETICQTPIKKEKESLLSKFEIPIDHLDYKYVETCNDAKELEKIFQILKSGQEGFFPQLQKCTEDRLREVHPRSKYLRVAVPILTKNDVSNEEWNSLSSDIQNWVDDIKRNDADLSFNKELKTLSEKVPIRSAVKSAKTCKTIPSRIKSMDYESWNKLDIDAEMLKMDLAEEKLKKETLKIQEKKEELNTVVLDAELMTEAELSHAAIQAKTNGNECFRTADYKDALQYYTNSINFKPLAATYNNRAITNIKLEHYKDAVSDCNEVLKLEPANEKALFRKAQALKLLKQYKQAKTVLEKLIQINPNNLEAQSMIKNVTLISGCKTDVKSVRMAIQDTTSTDLLTKTPENSKVWIPIPSTSKSAGPFYKEIPKETARTTKIKQNCEHKASKNSTDSSKIELATKYKTNSWDNASGDKQTNIQNPKICIVKSEESEMENKLKHMDKDIHKSGLEVISHKSVTEINTGITKIQVEDCKNNDEAMFPVDIENITPCEFEKCWQSFKFDRSFISHEKLLRLINPLDLVKVLGNKLDGEMLCTMLKCLEARFINTKDVNFVGMILTQLAIVPRIDIVVMFMNKEEKVYVKNLFEFLNENKYELSRKVYQTFNVM